MELSKNEIELPMKAFCLMGNNGSDKIQMTICEVFDFPERTSYAGGYDFRGTLTISVGCYRVCSEDFYSSTGELYSLGVSLEKCYVSLEGIAEFPTICERNLEFELRMTRNGHGTVKGQYTEYTHLVNSLIFEMVIDQTCIRCAIDDLKQVEKIFGDNKGKRTE